MRFHMYLIHRPRMSRNKNIGTRRANMSHLFLNIKFLVFFQLRGFNFQHEDATSLVSYYEKIVIYAFNRGDCMGCVCLDI